VDEDTVTGYSLEICQEKAISITVQTDNNDTAGEPHVAHLKSRAQVKQFIAAGIFPSEQVLATLRKYRRRLERKNVWR